MHELEEYAQNFHKSFDETTQKRDQVLAQARQLTRYCANAIRAVHRQELKTVEEQLRRAQELVKSFQILKDQFPDLYYTGYTQGALKEYAEANLVNAIINHKDLPSPDLLMVKHDVYLQGLAETIGELRRHCLDLLLKQKSIEAEEMLACMDDIYGVLVTIDYPDAITGGLRRLTDISRSIIERTRGDLTMSLRQERLAENLHRLEGKLNLASSSQRNEDS